MDEFITAILDLGDSLGKCISQDEETKILKEAEELYKSHFIGEYSYPKLMMVSNSPIDESNPGCLCVVELKAGGYYHAWNSASNTIDIDFTKGLTSWKYAKDVEGNTIKNK